MDIMERAEKVISNMRNSGDPILKKVATSEWIYAAASRKILYPVSYKVKDIDCFCVTFTENPRYENVVKHIGTQSDAPEEDIKFFGFNPTEFIAFMLIFERGITIIHNGTVSVMSYENVQKFLEKD